MMKNNNITSFVLIILLCLLGGCSSSRQVKYEPGFGPINESQLDQIVVGKTTKEEVLLLLGEPSKIEKMASGGELLKYETRKSEEVRARYGLFLYRFHYKEEFTKTLNIELNSRVVQKVWRN